MNTTLKNLVKLRIAGMLSEAAIREAEKKLLNSSERTNLNVTLTDTTLESNAGSSNLSEASPSH